MFCQLRWLGVSILCCLLLTSLHIIGVLSTGNESYSWARRDLFDQKNRDGDFPSFPIEPDLRLQSSYIFNAHEVLRKGLQQFLEFKDADLETYLNYLIYKRTEPFKDEYGQVIRVYRKVFRFIWEQHNETLVQNYAIKQFNKDKLDLCSVARYLSHQPTVDQRETIMKRMGDALGYRCHPCTPYKPKQYDETIVPSTDGLNPEGVSPEESLILCKEISQIQGQGNLLSYNISTTTAGTIMTIVESINPENPSLDYTPCSYSNEDVICDQVPLAEVQIVLKRTALPRLAHVKLTLQPFIFSETFIPKDVFETKRILAIRIGYPLEVVANRSLSLQVDTNAFRSTKNYTNTFEINMIDCTLLDLGFLSGFDKLSTLDFTNIYNIQKCLPTLPLLPSLTTLNIYFVSGMSEISVFPTLSRGLQFIHFFGDDKNLDKMWNDETVGRVMDWLLLSSSSTLLEMELTGMKQMTKVPPQFKSFKYLRRLFVYNNFISTLKTGDFSFSVPVLKLTMGGNSMNSIEPGAFQGDFTDTNFFARDNYWSRFEESVFGKMVQQMASGTGFINALRNPIDCSEESICHLAWIMPYTSGSKLLLNCSNGTLFNELIASGFNHCQ